MRAAVANYMTMPVPRYTSYPTAPHFHEGIGEGAVRAWLARLDPAEPISLYVHVPFCRQVCWYCGCNMKLVGNREGPLDDYVDALVEEIGLVADALPGRLRVSHVHFGGGTPTVLSAAALGRVMSALGARFDLLPDAEVAIECDPRTFAADKAQTLGALGFNRASFGVQEFDPKVQAAINRIQPPEMVARAVEALRAAGIASVNFDLIYGLPLQTPESFARTLAQVNALRPDRIALYAYAHLPSRFKPQRRIVAAELPSASDKLGMLSLSIDALLDAGYVYIGMDHFALPTDALAVARRQGRLHRNFQGYSTQPDCDLIALGVSAIGRIGATYSQNAKTLEEYRDLLDQGRLPIVRGLALTRDDLLRRAVIMSLMCQGEVQFEPIELGHLIDFRRHFAREIEALDELAALGLVQVDATGLHVTEAGWYLVRAIAMVFDRNLQVDENRARFSRII